MNPRLRTLHILQQITEKQKNIQECLSTDDTPFVYQCVYGTLRYYFSLSAMADYALKQPLATKDHDLYLLLLLGLFQLQYCDVPAYAVLKETVNIADKIKKSWAKKFINAVLRRFLREKKIFEQQCTLTDQAQYNHPQWLIERIKTAWPEQWKSILLANNEKAPMYLRVNRLKISRDAYQEKLQSLSISSTSISNFPDALCLTEAVTVQELPEFFEGWVSVQDAASQAVVEYLDLKPMQRILDACAAPGGKTCHILERQSDLAELIAIDVSPKRVKKIEENLERLQLKATVLCADATSPEQWCKKKMFDRILLDAPCSATGVIRRHPDIKYLRSPENIQQLIQQQQKLLESLWPLLKAQGKLVYTTCSLLPEENQQQIESFLKQHPDAQCVTLQQILPGNHSKIDGFFYAVMLKF